MSFHIIESLFGPYIARIIYKNIYDCVLAELIRERLKSEIRGERYVQIYSEWPTVKCLNCYAYGRNDEFGYHDCSCHGSDKAGEVRKLSYLEFLKKAALIRTENLYLYARFQNDRYNPDDIVYKYECNNSYIFKFNLDHIDEE